MPKFKVMTYSQFTGKVEEVVDPFRGVEPVRLNKLLNILYEKDLFTIEELVQLVDSDVFVEDSDE